MNLANGRDREIRSYLRLKLIYWENTETHTQPFPAGSGPWVMGVDRRLSSERGSGLRAPRSWVRKRTWEGPLGFERVLLHWGKDTPGTGKGLSNGPGAGKQDLVSHVRLLVSETCSIL